MKKETWKFIIQTIVAILTAIATSLGVTSCMNWKLKAASERAKSQACLDYLEREQARPKVRVEN